MAIRYRCPQCRQMLSIASRMAGQQVTCPSCGAETTVPDDVAAPARKPPRETELPKPERAAKQDRPEQTADEPGRDAETAPLPATTQPTRSRGETGTKRAGGAPPGTRPAADEDDVLVFRKAETEFEGMDLTPMVDVTFLLLIFFMITASFSLQKTIQVPPPDPEQQGAVQTFQTLDDLELTSVIVQIDENNSIFVDYDPVADKNDLPDVLRDKLQTDQKTELVLQSDPRAFHETVIAVIDAANEVQFQKIRLATVSGGENSF